MIPTLLLALIAAPQDAGFSEHLIAVVPAELSLEGTPFRDPNGAQLTPKSRIHWSADGLQVAYVGYGPDGLHPVIGETVGPAFDYIDPPVFGPTGAVVAFRAGLRKTKTKESWWVYRGEATIKKLGKARDWIGAIALDPEGEEAVFWTQPGAKVEKDGAYNRGSMLFESGWKKGKSWSDAQALTAPLFSPDGKQIFTVAQKGSEWFVLTIDKKGEKRSKQGYGMLKDMALHPDGDELALVVMDMGSARGGAPAGPGGGRAGGPKTVVQVDKQVLGAEFESAGSPTYSPNGKHLAYKARKGERYGIVLDEADEALGWHDYVTSPVFDAAGKQLAYVANEGTEVSPWWGLDAKMDRSPRTGQERVVHQDLKAKQVVEGEPFERVEALAWSPDGELLAFAALGEGGWKVHVGDTTSVAYDQVGALYFSPDGKRLAFGARSGAELWWRVLELK